MEEKLFTLQDIIDAWDASYDYTEQLDRINNGHSNLSVPSYPDKDEFLDGILKKLS